MKKVSVEDVIKAIENAQLNLDVNLRDLDPELKLADQGVDSLDMASILFEVEDAFKCEIGSADIIAGKWNSLQNICASINAQRK